MPDEGLDLNMLFEPFPGEKVSWRVGATNGDKTKGLALAYIDARDVMDRLDLVCGVDGWQCRYSHAESKTCCEIGIFVNGEWLWKANGAGDTAHEAEKGAFSDAFKRAAVMWGVGRYLYDLDSPWVAIEQKGRSYAIKPDELKKLAEMLRKKMWRGPLLVTELKAKAKEFGQLLEQVQTKEDLSALTTEYIDVLNQLKVDIPKWYKWDEEQQGAYYAIERKRAALDAVT